MTPNDNTQQDKTVVEQIDEELLRNKMESRLVNIFQIYNSKGVDASLVKAEQEDFFIKNGKIKVNVTFSKIDIDKNLFAQFGIEQDEVFIIRDNTGQMLIPVSSLYKFIQRDEVVWVRKPIGSLPL